MHIEGDFFTGPPPPSKKLKYGKPRLGESTLTQIGPDTPNLAKINFKVESLEQVLILATGWPYLV